MPVVHEVRGTWGMPFIAIRVPAEIPCHRVVFADGRICEGFAFGGPDAQRELLLGEGVTFTDPCMLIWPPVAGQQGSSGSAVAKTTTKVPAPFVAVSPLQVYRG